MISIYYVRLRVKKHNYSHTHTTYFNVRVNKNTFRIRLLVIVLDFARVDKQTPKHTLKVMLCSLLAIRSGENCFYPSADRLFVIVIITI